MKRTKPIWLNYISYRPMKKLHITLLLLFVIVSGTLYSQELKDNAIKNKFTVNVKEGIKEHDIFLLKNELKSSDYVIEYIYINHINRTVEFLGKKDFLDKYINILDKYFKKYEIIYEGELIYSTPNVKPTTEKK